MKIFIDTAELTEIKEAYSWGIVDGVTTNPSLIKKAVDARDRVNLEEYIEEILRTVDGPVSLEVIGLTSDDMIEEGKYLYDKFNSVNDNVVIKIPINTSTEGGESENYAGLKAISELSSQGIPVNTTLIMKPEQALLAAKAGAHYVSPFAGRIDDYI
ncbi:transaldolase, partial [Candidatus Bipolaricaulota bacterium]|nr:transaldolase [Candidatus Bipolaricaulota bacterium]